MAGSACREHDARRYPVAAASPGRAAAARGSEDIPVLRIEDRTYRLQARRVAAEHAVLVVVSDRTEELKREEAEREFIEEGRGRRKGEDLLPPGKKRGGAHAPGPIRLSFDSASSRPAKASS